MQFNKIFFHEESELKTAIEIVNSCLSNVFLIQIAFINYFLTYIGHMK